jgi:hypothetical protein
LEKLQDFSGVLGDEAGGGVGVTALGVGGL